MIQHAYRPPSLQEAVALKRERNALYFAGGTWVNWAAAGLDAEAVVLIDGLLDNAVARREDCVEIGAGITLQDLVDASHVPEALRRAAGMIPSRAVRNMATLGGNIAANRTDSYVIPALVALGAQVQTMEAGPLSVYDYISREGDALITRIVLPDVEGTCVVDRVVLSSAAYPTLTLGVRISANEAVLALGCVADHVIRLKTVEEEIVAGNLPSEKSVFDAVYAAVDPPATLKEGAAYRRYITATMVARAVTECGRASS